MGETFPSERANRRMGETTLGTNRKVGETTRINDKGEEILTSWSLDYLT